MNNKVILFAMLPVFAACSQSDVKEFPLHSVETITPQLVGQTQSKSYPGVIEEASLTKVGFKTAGQISRIYVHEGDHVSKGQLIAQLDTKDYQLGLDAAQIQYDQMKSEFERIKQLYDAQSISLNDYEKAEAGLRQLEIQLENKRNTIDYTRLTAPFEGYIMKVNSEEQEMVDAGTPLVSLMDVSSMEVLCDIPVQEYRAGSTGATYTCTSTVDNKPYALKLLSISPKADGNQLYQMRLTLPSNIKGLTSGQNVVVCISRSSSADTTRQFFTLPLHAIFERNGQKCVWTVQPDSTLHSLTVTSTELDQQGFAIITNGLSGNENIVRAGASTLQDGEKVKVLPKSESSNIGNLL